jgi:hypothetical protein
LPETAVKQNCQKKPTARRQIQLQQLLLHNCCSGQHNVPVSFRGVCTASAAEHHEAANAHTPMHDTQQPQHYTVTWQERQQLCVQSCQATAAGSSNSMPKGAAQAQLFPLPLLTGLQDSRILLLKLLKLLKQPKEYRQTKAQQGKRRAQQQSAQNRANRDNRQQQERNLKTALHQS